MTGKKWLELKKEVKEIMEEIRDGEMYIPDFRIPQSIIDLLEKIEEMT